MVNKWRYEPHRRAERNCKKKASFIFQPSCLLFNWECNFGRKMVDRMNELLLARQKENYFPSGQPFSLFSLWLHDIIS